VLFIVHGQLVATRARDRRRLDLAIAVSPDALAFMRGHFTAAIITQLRHGPANGRRHALGGDCGDNPRRGASVSRLLCLADPLAKLH
jgi:hypothetical protein